MKQLTNKLVQGSKIYAEDDNYFIKLDDQWIPVDFTDKTKAKIKVIDNG